MTAVSKQTLYDYFSSSGSATNSISTLESELEDLIDTFFGTWADYSSTSTIVGWTSYTTKIILYEKSGNRVYVSFFIEGTSDVNTCSITLPFTSDSTTHSYQVVIRTRDNGTYDAGYLNLNSGSSTVAIFPTITDTASTSWTTSGTKGIYGEFWYISA